MAAATTVPGLGDWWVDTTVWPNGLTPLIEHVRGRRHAVRHLGGARDGQPRQRSVSSAPGVGIGRRSVSGRARSKSVGARPRSPRGRRIPVRTPRCPADRSRHRLRQVGHEPRPRRTDICRSSRACIGRRSACTDCSTGCARRTPMSSSRHAHRAVVVWTSGSSSEPNGRGRATRSTRSIARRSSVDSRCCSLRTDGKSHRVAGGTHHGSVARSRLSGNRGDVRFAGIEWNLLTASDQDRAELSEIIELHKRLRPLLHHGDVVRLDHPDPNVLVHGVVAVDQSSAVFACTRLRSGPSLHTAPLRLLGLDRSRSYEVVVLPVGNGTWGSRATAARMDQHWHRTDRPATVVGRSQRPGPAARDLDAASSDRCRVSSGYLIVERPRQRSARQRGS